MWEPLSSYGDAPFYYDSFTKLLPIILMVNVDGKHIATLDK